MTTKSLPLSDNVIRYKRCSQSIWWMMYRWWCEGGGDRAWWVMESVFLRSPDKGFWACLVDLPPDIPRRPETWATVCNLMLAFRTAPLSSGRIVPRVTIVRVSPFIPSDRTNVRHSIVGYSRLPRPTPAPALMRVLHWLSGGTRVHHWQSAEDYGQIRGGCSFPWMIALD